MLLTDLAWQADTEMRFLGIRLNYNEVSAISSFLSLHVIGVSASSEDGGKGETRKGTGCIKEKVRKPRNTRRGRNPDC